MCQLIIECVSFVLAEEGHREHQLSVGAGDEKWQVRAGIQANAEDPA